jgi:uncharacterized Zn-binding protein involved in type VI secretion
MPALGRLGDRAATSTPDAHGCPACPHPAIGPAILGSKDVIVNGRPALRFQDTGMHSTCCGGGMWMAVQGSTTVFINQRPAFRVNDAVQHCGGIGKLIEGSGNVFVGDMTSAGAGVGASRPSAAMPTPTFAITPRAPVAPAAVGKPRAPSPPAPPTLVPPALAPSIAAISCPADAAPGQTITLRVARWHVPMRLAPLPAVSWFVDDKPCGAGGESVDLALGRHLLGKSVRVRATAGGKSTEATIHVPRLIVEGPTRVDLHKRIDVSARVEPATHGRFVWRDAAGAALHEGPVFTFEGQVRSVSEGDQAVTCHFTSSASGKLYRAEHPITVDDKPTVMLPIDFSHGGKPESIAWLAMNPVEVRVDGTVVPMHAVVEDSGRVVVSFRVEPGEHAVVITSGPANPPPERQKIRVVHFSAKVKVTEDRPARAVPSTKIGGGQAPAGGKVPPAKRKKPKKGK